MSKFKSLLTSALFTIVSIVNLSMTVLGQNDRDHELEPVGGVAATVNKLAVIAPYLVLGGIVAVATAIYIKRRKH
jgi:hypothetical protein